MRQSGVARRVAGPQGFPTGTTMLFHQTAAPISWTKDVATTLNDHALRIVTSTAWSSGSTGTDAYSAVFSAGKSTDTHALIAAELPSTSHSHTQDATTWADGATSPGGVTATAAGRGGTTGGADPTSGAADAHAHTMTMDLKYANVIIAVKD